MTMNWLSLTLNVEAKKLIPRTMTCSEFSTRKP